jgi:hypothetical protein
MARPISWLPRLADIRRSVAGSVRTHYDRPALQQLFQMQPRAAGKLLAILQRSEPLGSSHLVAKDELLRFLDTIHESDNASEIVTRQRSGALKVSRQKPRLLVRKDLVNEARLENLPKSITLEPGRVEVRFETKLEFLESMATLAGVLENDFEEFERRYMLSAVPPEKRKQLQAEANDIQTIFAELRQMEANREKSAN